MGVLPLTNCLSTVSRIVIWNHSKIPSVWGFIKGQKTTTCVRKNTNKLEQC